MGFPRILSFFSQKLTSIFPGLIGTGIGTGIDSTDIGTGIGTGISLLGNSTSAMRKFRELKESLKILQRVLGDFLKRH